MDYLIEIFKLQRQGCHRRLFFYYFEYQFFDKILLNFENSEKKNDDFFCFEKVVGKTIKK